MERCQGIIQTIGGVALIALFPIAAIAIWSEYDMTKIALTDILIIGFCWLFDMVIDNRINSTKKEER